MNHILPMKRHLTIAGIVASCLLASAPSASAALPASGTLIKAGGPAVYWYSQDGKRYVFPNEKTYKTWYADFSGVRTVTDAELASVPIGGNVTYRPGVKLVKAATDPRTYAVDRHGTLRWVASEPVASQLYGPDWNTKVEDIPDAFFVNYRIGAPIAAAGDFSPMAASVSASGIDEDLSAAPPSCTVDAWQCGDWGACASDGTQTRGCAMIFDCPTATTPSPAVAQSCMPSSNPPPLTGANQEGLVIAGRQNVILGKFDLTAQTESLQLTKVRIALTHPSSAADVLRMRLYDGTTPVSGDAVVGSDGNADFSGADFVIPRNGTKTLTVAADLNTIPDGARSGDDVSIKLHVPSTDDGTYELRGVSSGTDLRTGSGGDKTAFSKILRKTAPTVAGVDLSTSVLANGDAVVSRFSVTADAADQLSLKKLTFSISKSEEMGIASPGLRIRDSGSDLAGTAALSGGCAAGAGSACTVSVVLASEDEISAGATQVLELHVVVTGATSSSSALTNLLGDAAAVTGSLSGSGAEIGGTARDFIWSDESGVPHDDADGGSADWTDGLFVKVLPNDVQTID